MHLNPRNLSRAVIATATAFCLASVSSVTASVWAEDHKGAITDPADANEDYRIQGEYRGTLDTDGGESEFGAQVIALGDGKFRVVGFHGGLPGDGWFRGDESHSGEGKLQDGRVEADVNEAEIVIEDGKLAVTVGDKHLGHLEKTERKSPTLGAKPPADATVLFDGNSVDAFENGKLFRDKWLMANGCTSKKKLGDHQLHLEFRTPFVARARGQGRGNSGVYVQGRYEVQVLDSFGLEGKNNECGGIYQIAEPKVNMCLPPLTWQTYDMDFTAARYDETGKKTSNARITVRHNGVVIHEDLELPHHTPGRHQEGPAPSGLFLQDHGNPVVFRNIWVVDK